VRDTLGAWYAIYEARYQPALRLGRHSRTVYKAFAARPMIVTFATWSLLRDGVTGMCWAGGVAYTRGNLD